MRAGIYGRVRTSNSQQSPQIQTRQLREYYKRRGWEITSKYLDVGSAEPQRSVQS